LFLLLLGFIANYKNQSASIGYCDSGANVNDIVLHRQSALDNANACIARRTAMDLDNPGSGQAIHCDVSELPLVPFAPRPTACAPCPQHAVCEEGNIVACDPEYILTPHPLSIISPALDGLPGVGPKAFLPSCRPDTVKIVPVPEPEAIDPAEEADDEENDVIEVAPEPPVKRARGRASKAAQSVEQEDVPPVPKSTTAKPRGRPRKSTAPAATPDPSDDVQITVEVQKTPVSTMCAVVCRS